ncbi:hypothetical protein, partial [Xenorhabdus doucetiae]|uniref:hypothetical protein n=1 Tax=Xenorhabdus doucetiae TaxID=351671 RepID=UPI002B412C8B
VKNLGLAGTAKMPIGTTAHTLMAGDDARVTYMYSNYINERTALAVNKNASFIDLAGSGDRQLPVGMGLNAGGNFWDKFDVEFTKVESGVDPVTRPPIVRELLQYMKMDRIHFHGNFNIMKLTIKKVTNDFGSYVFYIPNQHVQNGCFMSFVVYHKIVGNSDWWWCDNTIKGRWHQQTNHLFSNGSPGDYVHIDFVLSGNSSVGDILYIALPQIVTGKWNPERLCPQLFNIGSGLGL